jgi:hypothetical protein
MKCGDLVMAIDGYASNKTKMIGVVLPSLPSKEDHRVLVGSQRKILLSNGEITWRNIWELEPIGEP